MPLKEPVTDYDIRKTLIAQMNRLEEATESCRESNGGKWDVEGLSQASRAQATLAMVLLGTKQKLDVGLHIEPSERD